MADGASGCAALGSRHEGEPVDTRSGSAERQLVHSVLATPAHRRYAAMRLCYAVSMRTTISLDDRLADAIRARAAEKGESVSAFIARTLDDALKRPEPTEERPFRLVTVGGEGVREGVDLDRPRELEVAEDEATWSKGG